MLTVVIWLRQSFFAETSLETGVKVVILKQNNEAGDHKTETES